LIYLKIFNSEGYNEKVDVYSFAIILWELLTSKTPYSGKSEPEVIMGVAQRGLRPEIPLNSPPDFRELLEECWSSDPEKRPCNIDISEDINIDSIEI
jgi:serine/threonine protein kinase